MHVKSRLLAILVAMSKVKKIRGSFIWPLLVSSGLGVALYLLRVIISRSDNYWYLSWNLFLGWLPLVYAYWLVRWLKKGRWLSVKGLVLTGLWLGFLPNSFYVLTDFIHLTRTDEIGFMFDVVMLTVFAWNGLLLGFISVYMIHKQMLKRLTNKPTNVLIGLTFLLSGFAIYLGRYLTWNTWDLIAHPGGILLDISDRVIKPTAYPNTFTVTALFFLVLTVMYYAVYKLVAAIKSQPDN